MNTPKTIILGLLLAGAFFTLGFVARNRRAEVLPPVRCDQTAVIDPAVLSQIARTQAAVALSQASGAASLLPFGF